MTMTPAESRHWALIVSSRSVTSQPPEVGLELRRAVIEGRAFTAEQQAIVLAAEAEIGAQAPERVVVS
jgi:hypothetical protein